MERNCSDEKSRRTPSGAAVPKASVTVALTRSFFHEWARIGYAGISLERVAAHAGVGKAALYRRWSSKSEMASDLLTHVGLQLIETNDMGSLEADLEAILLSVRRILRHRMIRNILVDLHAQMGREPALADAVRPMQQARRERVREVIARAVARRELRDDVDYETIADFVAAPLYWRLVIIGGRADRAHIRRLARMSAAAVAFA